MKQYINIIIQFIFAGSLVVGMNYLTKHFSAKYAALLYAVPVLFTIAAVVIFRENNKQVVQDLCISSLYSTLILCTFLGMFYIFLKKFNFSISLLLSYVIFFACGLVYLKLLR